MDHYLTTQFHALGDKTRLAVVERLMLDDASVGELAKPFNMALPAFMKHLKILEQAGLISTIKVGRVRNCALNTKGMENVEDWFANRHNLWEMRLHRLSHQLNTNKKSHL